MSDDSSPVRALSADLTELKDELKHDLESALNHPCRVVIEEYDIDTGELTARAEPDLARLREQLRDVGVYDSLHLGISGDLTIQLSPKND